MAKKKESGPVYDKPETFTHKGLKFNGEPITVTHTHTPGLGAHRMTVEHGGKTLDLDLGGSSPGVRDDEYPVDEDGNQTEPDPKKASREEIKAFNEKISRIQANAFLRQPRVKNEIEKKLFGSNLEKGTAAEETNRLMQKIVDVISEQNKKGFR
jgi:hypothetical protein